MENQNMNVLITGPTEGIGYELAKKFASEGFNLVLVARDENDLERIAADFKEKYGIQVETVTNDLIQKESPKQVYDTIKSQGIQIDILVNNAAQGQYGLFKDTDLDREIDIIQLNIIGSISLTKHFLKDMLDRKSGKILNVGSVAGEIPGPWQSVYHGTKAFVNSWTMAICNELQDSPITVTLLLPGPTDTEFFDKAEMENSKIVKEGDLADPAKVAKDGFEALMAGKDKIISGLKNKAMVGMSHIMTDQMAAESMRKQQKPAEE
jgi:uncharacterized protein